MPRRRTVLQASLAATLVAATAGLATLAHERLAPGVADDAGWRPIAWPFPRDAWPAGRAWRRDTTEVYVRPKLGFCGNCETGVTTDEEVDKVVDIDLLDERFVPARDGTPVRIAALPGRSRLYRYTVGDSAARQAEGIAVSRKCDLVVAVIAGNLDDGENRAATHRFLASGTVQDWITRQLEGR